MDLTAAVGTASGEQRFHIAATADADLQEWVGSGLLEVAYQFVMLHELASELFDGQLDRIGKNKIFRRWQELKTQQIAAARRSTAGWRLFFCALLEITLSDKPELG